MAHHHSYPPEGSRDSVPPEPERKSSLGDIISVLLIIVYGGCCLAALYYGVNQAMDQFFQQITPNIMQDQNDIWYR